ncbi:MAG: thioredoxin domain-containing protein [Proteobacteria bacterium]|nr:thioredoxin domain-containing protein [Pseudomonadota bacterium]
MMRNLLSEETSPYLLQHRNNPVHWQPWSADTLARAKKDNKPILLSIGYAACHWCHVMAHESFENDAIAAQMNDLFINIKVDREERPDIDAIYQSALQMMGEQGGWPLTMFLTPDGAPFWGGTYFPATARYGRPAFPELLKGIAGTYHREPDKVRENAAALKDGLMKMARPEGGGAMSLAALDAAAAAMLRYVDFHRGGTQGAPKFPQPMLFQLLWLAHQRQKTPENSQFGDAVTITLDHLCQGGIYDHLGGGFSRYSTDEVWLAPHFEKMLYDNALLIELLSDVWQQTQSPLYAVRVRETIAWARRDMRSTKDGGAKDFAFTSAYDADSDGEEGRFYVWSEAEIDAILGAAASDFKQAYDVTAHGNWEHKTILNRSHQLTLGPEQAEAGLARSREKLLAVREARVWPQRDDKVLADWNGMMIAALAKAGAVFDEPAWIDTAETVFRFVIDAMTETRAAGDKKPGRLNHTWCAGKRRHPAVVDDYANMARAALMLHGITGNDDYLTAAKAWVEIADAHYWDSDGGGYFLGADDTGDVITRTKTLHDNAVPSGNGVMAEVLARLFHLTGDDRYRNRLDQLFAAIAHKDSNHLGNQPSLLNAFALLETAVQIVIVAETDDPAAVAFRRAAFEAGLSRAIIMQIAPETALPAGHPANGKKQENNQPTAFVCRGPVCGLPITDIESLREQLAGS